MAHIKQFADAQNKIWLAERKYRKLIKKLCPEGSEVEWRRGQHTTVTHRGIVLESGHMRGVRVRSSTGSIYWVSVAYITKVGHDPDRLQH